MYKKRILGLAIASAFTLTGCLDEANPDFAENGGSVSNPDITSELPEALDPAFSEGKVWPVFNPGESKLPIPNDLIYQKDSVATEASEADGTYEVADSSPPVTTALNELSGASTIAPIDIPLSGEVNPASVIANGTVFLIAVDYASGSPLQALSISEPPTVNPANQPSFNVTVESYDGGTNNVIRINLDEPLLPNTRYVVGLSKSILDGEGEQIIGSPGLTGYAYLTDPDPETPLASDALTSVVSLIDFWERTIVGFTAAVPAIPDVSSDQIAMSYSFTTSNDEKVLTYIADPAQWFEDQINSAIGIATASATLEANPAADFSAIEAQIAGATSLFPNIPFTADDDESIPSTLTNTFADLLADAGFSDAGIQFFDTNVEDIGADCDTAEAGVTPGSTYISCLSNLLGSTATGAPLAALLPKPSARNIDFSGGTAVDIKELSSLTGSLSNINAGEVSVIQGAMELPYYLETPDLSAQAGLEGLPLIQGSWEANDTLASAIQSSLRLQIPQSDPSVSTAVSGNFPFPKLKDTQTVPVLAIYPTNPTGPLKTVIFQHGITTDRSAALAFGGSMVQGGINSGQDIAIIAIDQPLHGIAGISTSEKQALTEKLLVVAGSIPDDRDEDGDAFDGQSAVAQSTIDAIVAGIAYIGVLQATQAAPCPALSGLDLSGATPADIGTALAEVTAGNCGGVAQAQLASTQLLERTIANAGATIPGLENAKDGLGDDVAERHFNFTSGSPAPVAMDLNGSKASNGSGSLFVNLTNFLATRDNLRQGSVDLLNLRMTIGDISLGGEALDANNVYFIGHSLGTVNGLPFLAATDNSTTTADDIVAANLLTPGGGLTRFLENSPSFGPRIVIGLKQLADLTQDSSSFQSYVNVFQAAVDSADAVNFADNLTTPTLLSEVINDLTIPNQVDATQVATAGVYINGAAAQIEAQTGVPLNLSGSGSVSALSGTEPLATITGANDIADNAGVPQPLTQNIVRYIEGAHSTPVFPTSDTLSEAPALQATFAEMVGQATSIVVTNGADVITNNTSGIDVLQ